METRSLLGSVPSVSSSEIAKASILPNIYIPDPGLTQVDASQQGTCLGRVPSGLHEDDLLIVPAKR